MRQSVDRAKNSARPWYGCSYHDSAPVLSRFVAAAITLDVPNPRIAAPRSDEWDHLSIHYDDGDRATVLGKTAPTHGSKPARENLHVSHAMGAPSFSPYRRLATTNREVGKK
jgi:hypothetical protein